MIFKTFHAMPSLLGYCWNLCHKLRSVLSFLGVSCLNRNFYPTDISGNTSFLLVVWQNCTFSLWMCVWILCVCHVMNISTNIFMLLQPFSNMLFKLYPLVVTCLVNQVICLLYKQHVLALDSDFRTSSLHFRIRWRFLILCLSTFNEFTYFNANLFTELCKKGIFAKKYLLVRFRFVYDSLYNPLLSLVTFVFSIF